MRMALPLFKLPARPPAWQTVTLAVAVAIAMTIAETMTALGARPQTAAAYQSALCRLSSPRYNTNVLQDGDGGVGTKV